MYLYVIKIGNVAPMGGCWFLRIVRWWTSMGGKQNMWVFNQLLCSSMVYFLLIVHCKRVKKIWYAHNLFFDQWHTQKSWFVVRSTKKVTKFSYHIHGCSRVWPTKKPLFRKRKKKRVKTTTPTSRQRKPQKSE